MGFFPAEMTRTANAGDTFRLIRKRLNCLKVPPVRRNGRESAADRSENADFVTYSRIMNDGHLRARCLVANLNPAVQLPGQCLDDAGAEADASRFTRSSRSAHAVVGHR